MANTGFVKVVKKTLKDTTETINSSLTDTLMKTSVVVNKQKETNNNEEDAWTADLIKQLNRELGEKTAYNLNTDDAPTNIKRWTSTGSTQLDYIIRNESGGGHPEGRIIEIQGATSCHKKGETVLMFDGSIKKVEEVLIGEQLMGPDSNSRTVLKIHSGTDKLFKVKNSWNEEYTFNSQHELALIDTKERIRFVKISEYKNLCKFHKRSWQWFQPKNGIEFQQNSISKNFIIDPYILGLLIGDGSIQENRIELTSADQEIVDEFTAFGAKFGYTTSKHPREGNASSGYYFKTNEKYSGGKKLNKQNDTNLIRKEIRKLGLLNTKSETKFIPKNYLLASRKDRLELLAGLIDTDGHACNGINTYEFVTKSKFLAENVKFLCRSLGFKTTTRPKIVNGIVYQRMFISGNNLHEVPSRLTRKKFIKKSYLKRMHSTAISVEEAEYGEFVGFTVDQDNLYLNSNFAVIKNCGKSHLSYEAIKNVQKQGGIAVYIDTENATSVENLKSVGIDTGGRFVFVQQNCIEKIFQTIELTVQKARNLKKDIPILVVWDSIAASAPLAEIEGDYDQNTIGLAARVYGKGFRKLTSVIGNLNVTLLLINQNRQKVGISFGDPTTTPGGLAIPYACSLRIRILGGSQIKKTINGKEVVIGINVSAKTIKNKVGRPWREVEFEIHFGKGIVEDEQLFNVLREHCEKTKDPVIAPDGNKVILSGTAAWKYFQVSDPKTGEIIHDEKFQKSTFKSNILDNPKYAQYMKALLDACFIIKTDTSDHKTLASVNLDSEIERTAFEQEREAI